MYKSLPLILAIAAALLTTACAEDEVVYEDEGQAMLVQADEDVPMQIPPSSTEPLSADRELQVLVQFDNCTGCEEIRERSCEATVDGNVIEVTGRAVTVPQGGICPAVCGFLTVTCDVGTLPEGDYTLRYGGDEVAVSIPSEDSPIVGTDPDQ